MKFDDLLPAEEYGGTELHDQEEHHDGKHGKDQEFAHVWSPLITLNPPAELDLSSALGAGQRSAVVSTIARLNAITGSVLIQSEPKRF